MFHLDATPALFRVKLEQAMFCDEKLRHPVVVQSLASQHTKRSDVSFKRQNLPRFSKIWIHK